MTALADCAFGLRLLLLGPSRWIIASEDARDRFAGVGDRSDMMLRLLESREKLVRVSSFCRSVLPVLALTLAATISNF